MLLAQFLKKIDTKVLITATKFAFKLAKIKNMPIKIDKITLDDVQKANVNTLLSLVDKEILAKLIIQVLQQASKTFLDIQMDNSAETLLKKCFTNPETEKLLRDLITQFYKNNSSQLLEQMKDKVDDKTEISLANINTYFIVINNKLEKKNSLEEIKQQLNTDDESQSYVYGRYIDPGIYLVDVESNIDTVAQIKKLDTNCKKIYKVNEQSGSILKLKRLAIKIY